eukprot:6446640-Pyramimonas_sp.AAC.1
MRPARPLPLARLIASAAGYRPRSRGHRRRSRQWYPAGGGQCGTHWGHGVARQKPHAVRGFCASPNAGFAVCNTA